MTIFPFAHPVFQKLVAEGLVILGDIKVSNNFNEYLLKNYEWFPSRIDWSSVSDTVRLSHTGDISDQEVIRFLKTTRLSSYIFVGIINSYREPSFITDLEVLEEYFDLLLSPLISFIVGVEKSDTGKFIFHFDDFVERSMDDDMLLTGRRSKP